MITALEIGWLAGILEGEGHFRFYTTQEIVVTTTDQDVAIRIAELFTAITGQVCVVKERSKLTAGNQTAFNVNICGERARMVMHAIVKHMSIRRRSAIWRALHKVRIKQKSLDDVMTNVVVRLRGSAS